MAIDRRTLIAALIAPAIASRAEATAPERRLFVSCRMDGERTASVAVFDDEGREVFSTSLPSRGHDSACRPGSSEIAVFARRPGNWFVILREEHGGIVATVHAARNRHFYGHGVFSGDGKLLYATENDTLTGDGVVGVYDATAAYARLGEFASGGVGPHDIALLPGRETLLIANGGLRTLPETGREVLNPGAMQPNFATIDPRHGDTRARIELDRGLRQLSIRHLAMARSGTAAFGCQYQGPLDDLPPLVGLLSPEGRVMFLNAPEEALGRMRNYIGSVAFDDSEEVLAATSPHGGQILLWSIGEGKLLAASPISDACGIAASGDGRFLASSGNAGLRRVSADAKGSERTFSWNWVWDNHMRRLA
jgi:hypothetical protein